MQLGLAYHSWRRDISSEQNGVPRNSTSNALVCVQPDVVNFMLPNSKDIRRDLLEAADRTDTANEHGDTR